MKEATTELSSALVAVVCIATLVAFFYFQIWPSIKTNFLFVVMVVSILVFMCITAKKLWLRLLLRVLLVPVVAGISYEFIRLAGNHDNAFTRILSAPGLAMQRLTTREPDDSMIEIAIAALTPCIPEDKEEDKW